MSHKFKIISFNKVPHIISNYLKKITLKTFDYKICEKCNLLIAWGGDDTKFNILGESYYYEYFFLNNKEIYRELNNLIYFDISCEELMIKNIIE